MIRFTAERQLAAFRAERLSRLADAAERAGVRILVDHRTGQHVAADADNPTACYLVDADGCTCRRFALWGRCWHHALLSAERGLIRHPDEERETPTAQRARVHPNWLRPVADPAWVEALIAAVDAA